MTVPSSWAAWTHRSRSGVHRFHPLTRGAPLRGWCTAPLPGAYVHWGCRDSVCNLFSPISGSIRKRSAPFSSSVPHCGDVAPAPGQLSVSLLTTSPTAFVRGGPLAVVRGDTVLKGHASPPTPKDPVLALSRPCIDNVLVADCPSRAPHRSPYPRSPAGSSCRDFDGRRHLGPTRGPSGLSQEADQHLAPPMLPNSRAPRS